MRALPYNFELALQQGRRRPTYKIIAFDPKLDSMSAVVCGTYTQTPLDLTAYCTDISWTPERLSFSLKDSGAIFHPDFGEKRNYLADSAIIRLQEGDLSSPDAEWINSFTGMIQGQTGWRKSRRSKSLEAKITVYSRENNQSWKRRTITSRSYTTGTEIGVVLHDIATTFMGLSDNEIRIPVTLGLQLKHMVNQIVQVAPWEAITSVLEAVGAIPIFDGDGRLTCYSKAMTLPEARRLIDWRTVLDYEVPEYNQESINKVRVVFIDANLERVDGAYQKLGDAQVTTGFFSRHEKLVCWWSDDHRQRASGTKMIVKKSVNSGLIPVGKEIYKESDDFHGEINVEISVWVPILASVMALEYVAAAFIPDITIGATSVGGGVGVVVVEQVPGTGWTIPTGRILQAQAMLVIMLLMMSIGSAQYEVWGTPYDMCYLEKESSAIECNIEYWQINEQVIKNDFMGSYEQADAIALMTLVWEKSKAYPRRLTIQDDPYLEIGDMIRLPDGLKFFITGMNKSVKRSGTPILILDGFKVKRA